MNENKFDKVMEYVDSNIMEKDEEIKRGVQPLIGENSFRFGICFSILTNKTFGKYIKERRLYFVSKMICEDTKKPLCDVAQEFGYADQTSLTRAMRNTYHRTPNEIRRSGAPLKNNRIYLDEICVDNSNSKIKNIFNALRNGESLSSYEEELLLQLQKASDELGFDIDVCYQIADLADSIGVFPMALMGKCIELVDEFNEDDMRDEIAISAGIRNRKDIEKICNKYGCKYYEIDAYMVDCYYKNTDK